MTLLLGILGVATILLFSRWRRAGTWLVAIVVAGLVLVAVVPVGHWLVASLENRFTSRLPARVDGIIVLGGEYQRDITDARGQLTLRRGGSRLLAFVALARRYPDARLVFAGGLGSLTPATRPALRLFTDLGIDPGRLTFEERARNTYENAVLGRRVAAPRPGEVWVLVTSALHTPRAVGVFRRAGWPVVPHPVDFQTDGRYPVTPTFSPRRGLALLWMGTREWVALSAYRLRGWTAAWLPSDART